MRKLTMVAAALAALASPMTMAESKFFVTAGGVNVSPDATSGNLPVVESLAGAPAGSTSVDVDNNTQLGITFGYKYNENVTFELLAATPFSHTATAYLSGNRLTSVGKTKHLPPTLTVQYQFGDANSAFRPFIGAGVNYTWFFDTNASEELVNTLNSVHPDKPFTTENTDLKLSNSTGFVYQLGFDYKINDQWSIRGSYWNMDIETDAKVRLNGADIEKVNIQIDPNVYFLGAKYSF